MNRNRTFRTAVRQRFDRIKLYVRSIGARVNAEPLFVLGNQKSGTSAIAALLAEYAGLSATLDLQREIHEPLIDRLRQGLSMGDFVKHHKLDFSRDLIKEPSLTPFYAELAAHFPKGRFVMVIRDPRDNIRSILNRHDLPGDLTGISKERMAQMSRAWQLIFDGCWLGISGDNYIEQLANRWNHTADVYLRHTDGMVLSRFETFLQGKVAEIERLAGVLGLSHRNDITHRVDVQFQPAGNRGVTWPAFFGENLGVIERLCAERMKALGYATTVRQ